MKISVITPCFNAVRFLGDLHRSLVCQGVEDLEWVVVDDGSGDRSVEELRRLEIIGEIRMRVFTGPNRGACAARNQGFAESTGDWVKFLDADDLLEAGHLRVLIKEAEVSAANTVPLTSVVRRFERRGRVTQTRPRVLSVPPDDLGEMLRQFLAHPLFHHSCGLYPRTAVEGIGGWDESLRADQDGDFLLRLILQGTRFRVVEGPCFIYRIHSGERISGTETVAKIQSRLQVADKVEAFLRERPEMADSQTSLAHRLDRVAMRAWRVDPALGKSILARARELCPNYRVVGPTWYRLARRICPGCGARSLGVRESLRSIFGR